MRPQHPPRIAPSTAPLYGLIGSTFLFLSPPAIACPSQAEKTATVEMDLGGGATARVAVNLFDYEKLGVPEEYRPEDSCTAYLQARLSDFPSIESRYGTARIADAIASVLAEWEISRCAVATWYHNDVGADFAEHELCRSGRYGFEDGRTHSLASESYCWEPFELDEIQPVSDAELEELEADVAPPDDAADVELADEALLVEFD